MKSYFFLLVALSSFCFIHNIQATHIRAGEITAELVSCQGFTYKITITGYEDTESGIEFGEGVLDMGDGSVFVLDPGTDFVTRTVIDGDKQIRVTVFEKIHTFPGAGEYTITYLEKNRNEFILNMANSIGTSFFIQTQVSTDPFYCNTTPMLTNAPVDGAVVGQTFVHNPGAYDKDGDSLAFKMVVPLQEKDLEVDDYTYPDQYDRDRGDNINPIRQDGTQPVFLTIDSETGTVTWDAPANPGEYNISFIIEEWRKIDGEWFFLGYVTRDMQIIVEDADNERPDIADLPDTCVVAGSLIEWTVSASDPDGDQIYFSAFGEAFDLLSSPANFSPSATAVNSPAEGILRWQTSCQQVRTAPYQMNIKVNDLPSTGPTLADYMDFNVTIVGPAPVLNTITQQQNAIGLQWNAYTCADQAVSLSLYRKKGESNFTPDVCQTGIPAGLGFEKIADLDAGLMAYRDTNEGEAFEPGVTYCYRLVANFPDGSESLVSEEFCTTIPTNASFLTKVSVRSTSATEGSIEINWSRSLNPDALPENYTFTLLRGTGFTSAQDEELEIIASGLTDTLFIDEGLNTEDEVYHYQVVISSLDNQPLEYSAKASSVRLSAQADRGSVALIWQAEVSWSNQTGDYPYHYIYRAVGVEPELSEMALLDSVQVTDAGFTFEDRNLPETESSDIQICYVIQTQGRYSPDLSLPAPLLNFSQRICVSPLDSIPPCPPTALMIDNAGVDVCASFLEGQPCDFSGFENRLEWLAAPNECAADLGGYNVYFSADGEEEYQKIASLVQDNFYVDGPLASYAGCYRIAAVDLSGNESEWSEPFCRDNCPSFALPNVFTPNGDGINETFEAMREPFCPRFVERVVLKVYNRWGKMVYHYDSEENQQRETNLISYWDGVSDTGTKVSAGVYYYQAEVSFKVLDPNRAARTYKGWVQVSYETVVGR